eukprot:5754174-Amphidinium_carterae.2
MPAEVVSSSRDVRSPSGHVDEVDAIASSLVSTVQENRLQSCTMGTSTMAVAVLPLRVVQ